MNLLLLLLIISGVTTPTDLPKIDLNWRVIEDDVRIDIARIYAKKYGYLMVASCLALMKIEQPPNKQCPDNNLSGWHPFKERYPWGWSRYWERAKVRPDGYYNAYEAATGWLRPYFHFEYFQYNFKATLMVVVNRNIYNGRIYNTRWVGVSGNNNMFDKYRDEYILALIVKE